MIVSQESEASVGNLVFHTTVSWNALNKTRLQEEFHAFLTIANSMKSSFVAFLKTITYVVSFLD